MVWNSILSFLLISFLPLSSSPSLFSPLCSPLPSSLHDFPTPIIILTAKDISSLYNFVQFTQPIIHILNYNSLRFTQLIIHIVNYNSFQFTQLIIHILNYNSLQFTQPIIHNLNSHLQVTVSHNPKQRPWLQNCEPLWQMQGHQNHLVYEVSRSK